MRHGHGPERAILTGIGPVVVRRYQGPGPRGNRGPELAGLRRLDPQDPPLPVHYGPAQRHDLSPPHPGNIPNQKMSRVAGTMTSASMAAHQRGRTSAGVEIRRRTARW